MAPTGQSLSRQLLLLPPPPAPSSFASVKAAYEPSVTTVLQEVGRYRSAGSLVEIALPCPHLHQQPEAPRSHHYASTQALLAALYKLVCIVAARDEIDIESPNGIDIRVILIAYDRDSGTVSSGRAASNPNGPVTDIVTLASSARDWQTVYAVESEEGEKVLQYFTKIRNSLSISRSGVEVQRVKGGIVQVSEGAAAQADGEKKQHYSIAVGGTFDHLHIGHRLLLTMFAFALDSPRQRSNQQRTLTIGITGDELLKNKKFAEVLESWQDRYSAVRDFIESIMDFSPEQSRFKVEEKNDPGPNGHAIHVYMPDNLTVKYVEIPDPFGPTITDEAISALVISAETRAGGKAVNDKRAEKGWPPLEVFEVDVLDADEEDESDAEKKEIDQSFQNKLSSTAIRKRLHEEVQVKTKM